MEDIENISVESCPDEKTQFGSGKQCQSCSGKTTCLSFSSEIDPDEWALMTRMKVIKHKIIVMSGKGGVGKSTFAAQFAMGLAKQGMKVGILDLDVCGPSIPRMFHCEDFEVVNQPWGWIPAKCSYGVAVMSIGFMTGDRNSPIIWKGPRKSHMIKKFLKDTFWGKLDYLIIDTPPGTSDEHLSTILTLRSSNPDGGIIVTTPQEVALSTIKREIKFCNKIKLPILGIVENMSGFTCPCCNEVTNIFPFEQMQNFVDNYSLKLLGKIPLDPRLTESSEQGEPIYDKYSDTPFVKAYNDIIETFQNDLV